jgi:aspartyl-tRNA(Asn)/glutamyl-tRNA(Gln) amidotransferase subunit A
MPDSPLLDLTAAQLAEKIRRKEVSSRQATQAVVDRIAEVEGRVRAFNSTDPEWALKQAAAVDEALAAGKPVGPLAGVPIALKDNMATRRGTTTCSSKILKNFTAPYDAHVVERLAAAGAVAVGKTNLDEFAMGSSTENSGFHTSRNPWDPERVPGGSSGGSAAAVAAGEAFAALGSDTGGSIRQPAALCALAGLKPTYGRVSRFGLVAFASSLDQIGPMCRDIRDTALMMNVIAGPDRRDSTCVPEPAPDYLADLDKPLDGLKIGLLKGYNGPGVDGEVIASVENALNVYRKLGATVREVDLPATTHGLSAYYIIAPAEASSNLARYDGVHYGHRTAAPKDFIDMYTASRAEGLGAEVKRRIMLGTFCLSKGYGEKFYDKALRVRRLIKNDYDAAFRDCHVIVSPTSPTPAFKVGDKGDDPLAMYLCDLFTIPANLAGIPALSICSGFTKSGLPIGLQLCGPNFSEGLLLRAARMFESQTDFHGKRAKL